MNMAMSAIWWWRKTARRRGIARMLLDDCERRARDAGRDDLRITVLARNEGARALYRVTRL